MAMIAGGAGSPAKTSTLGIGVGAGFGAPVNLWEEEEERRRRELAKAQAQQRLTQKEKQLNPTWNAPTAEMKKRADTARTKLAAMSDPLTDYWKLSRTMGGQEKLAQRMRQVKALWDMYLKPADGSQAIMDLVRSDYTIEEIEAMCQAGHLALYTTMFDGQFKVPAKLVNMLGLDPDDPTTKKRLETLVAARGYLSTVPSVAKSLPQMKLGWAAGRRDDPDTVDWALSRGSWDNESLDPADDLQAIRQLEQLRLESSKKFQSFRPEVQERLQWLWYEATGDPNQEPPWGKNPGMKPLDMRRPDDLVMWKGDDEWAPKGISKEEWKALLAGLSLWRARMRVSDPEQWSDIKADHEFARDVIESALLLAIGRGVFGAAKTAASAIKSASAAARAYRGMRMGRHGLEVIGGGPSLAARAGSAAVAAGGTAGIIYGASRAVETATEGISIATSRKIREMAKPAMEFLESEGFQNELEQMIQNAHGLPQTDAVAMQKQIQQGIVDPDTGETIIGAYGKELEPNGLWTWEWDQALSDFWADIRRYDVEIERRLMEAGYASMDLPIGGPLRGPLADPRWVEAREAAMRDMEAQMAFAADHPILAEFLKMTGIPITRQGVDAWWNRVFANGPLTGVLSLLTLEPVKRIGGAYNATLSALTYGIVQDSDEEYQTLKSEWLAAVANGSPDAQEKQTALLKRQSELLQNAFVPDPIMATSVGFGKDVNEAIAWSQDHPNWVLAASLARDAAMMRVTPHITRAARGRFRIDRTDRAFMRSLQPNSLISEMVGYVRDKKLGMAEDVVKGTEAHKLVRQVEAVYNGQSRSRMTGSADYYDRVAQRMIQAADTRNLGAMAKELTLRGVELERLAERIRNTQAQSGLTGQAALDSRRSKVARVLGQEQKRTKNLLDMEYAAKAISADMWAKNASIFPYFQDVSLPKAGGQLAHLNRKLLSAISEVENPTLQRFLSVGIKQVQLKPMRHVDMESVYGSARVFSNALAAYGDVSKAMQIRSRWVRNPNPSARIKLAEEVKAQLDRRFNMEKAGQWDDAGNGSTALGVDPATGQVISEGAVGIPTYLRYTADFGRVEASARAPYNLINAVNKYDLVVKKYMVNPWRAIERKLTYVSNPLRQWTVALGPMLFVKHGITDTSRTVASVGTGAVLRAAHNAKQFEAFMQEMTPATANRIRYLKQKARTSEEHFNVGNVHAKVDWSANRMYVETRPGVFKPVNLARGVEALRRIASDPVFLKYVEGGVPAVRSWLHTKEGHEFMNRGRHIQDFLDDGGEMMLGMQGVKINSKTIYEGAVEYYLDRYVRGMIHGLESVAPRIFSGLSDMAKGRVPLTEKGIKNLVKEVNDGPVPRENPWLSTPEEARTNNMHPATWTARWMTPNKLNRVATFNYMFNKAYKDLRKSGARPDEAGLIAADIAELGVARVHFDLANALYIEAAHRWFAWFATKHRLYNTYVLKLAAERPSIAGAAQTLYDWIEKRNENEDLPEWDKHTIQLPLDWLPDWLPAGIGKKGSVMRLNISTIFWLSEYYTESSMGQLAEMAGAKILSMVPGIDIPYQMSGFGISTGRWDRLGQTLGACITTFDSWGDGQITDEWVQEWFDGKHASWLGGGAKKRIQKSMNIQMAAAMREGREMTPAQAFKAAMLGALFYETIQMGKVWPGRIVTGEEDYYEDAMLEFNKLSPEDRYARLQEDPSIRYLFGLYSTNPVDQHSIVDGWQAIAKIFRDRAIALEDALNNGTILDKNKVDSIYAYYDNEIDKIVNPDWRDPDTGEPSDQFNQTFAEVWTSSGMAELSREEILKSIFPLCDPRAVTLDGYIPTRRQRDIEQDRLQVEFEELAEAMGLNPSDTDDPRVKWLKNDRVTEPLAAFMKYQDGEVWTTNFANTVARDLARGEAGPSASAKFLTQLQNQEKLKLYARGTSGDAKAGVEGLPMFATMTVLEKEEIGWKSNKQTEMLWRLYCQMKAELDDFMDENNISKSSAKADQLRAELKQFGDRMAQTDTGFAVEWSFSHLPLWKRLEVLGVGTGNTRTDEGWSAFLDVVNAYQDELASTWNKYTRSYGVGSTSQTAYPIYLKYGPRLAQIKQDYPEFWKDLLRTFGGISKFGFVRWRSPEPWDDELWLGQRTSIYDPTVIGGE